MESNKKEKIIFCISAIFALTIIVLLVIFNSLNNLDEVWIFNFSKNMADGLLPYRDFNYISTPLLPFILSVVFRIFGSKIIVQRIVSCILFSSIIYMIYIITKKFISGKIAIPVALWCILLFNSLIHIDYNFLSLLFILIALFLELKNNKEINNTIDHKKEALIGILTGLTILTKQSIGIVMLLGVVLYKITLIRKKEDVGNYLKIAGIRLFSAIISLIPFVIYLFATNTYLDFLDHCVFGLSTFSNIANPLVWILGIIIFLAMSLFVIIKRQKDNNVYTLLTYSIINFVCCIPIADEIHTKLAMIVLYIFVFYLLYTAVIKKEDEGKIRTLVFTIPICILLIIYSSARVISCTKNYYLEKDIYAYQGLFIAEDVKKEINEIDNYIILGKQMGKNVYILDASSAVFNIPLNIYRKYYDLLLIGNLGKVGEDGIIEDIKNNKKTIYLIHKDEEKTSMQNAQKVIDFVKNNYNLTGEIGSFYIYQ